MRFFENLMQVLQAMMPNLNIFNAKSSVNQQNFESTDPDMIHSHLLEVAIIDDIFPHPLSAFRMQEYISYLQEFKNLEIYSSGASVALLGKRTFDELITDFKVRYPEYAERFKKLTADITINAKLIYAVFLINVYLNIQKIEESKTPFVFTLYPGGGFGLNIADSDNMLRRVTSSPCFRKVIVTQKMTYNYLINNNYCKPDQIKYIFGVVTPLDYIYTEYTEKKHFGIDKETLDICFVAYKYTEKGVDKGYDVFIDVAHQLCRSHDNIHFHVVGGIDEHEIDVTDLEGKITFYGKRDLEWFNSFYKDKDIILSPNIPGTMYPGSFDGFPTASCTEAGLRKTAIFCTDELGLNTKIFSEGNEFVEGEEIIIIPHDAIKITNMIEGYYHNPQKLKAIAESGSLRIKQLYSFEAQILPRINLLKKEIELADDSKESITKIMDSLADTNGQNLSSIRSVAQVPVQFVEGKPETARSDPGRKIGMIFHRIRHLIAPSGSRQARLLRRIYNNYSGKFMHLFRLRSTRRDLALIQSSSLFDAAWYLAKNPDVAQAKLAPALHYLRYGGFEGRDPSPDFYGNGYLEVYPDVRTAGINPLLHYLKFGAKEGRILSLQRQPIQLDEPQFICPVCQNRISGFQPLGSYYEENWNKHGFPFGADDFETLNSRQYFCPICGAADRDRLYALYLPRVMNRDLSEKPITIIDIAPSSPLKNFLLEYPNIKYQSADMYMKDVDLVVDITNMHSIPEEAYDIFICSHVLEHVSDDKKALSELYRILKTGGSGILMVPINLRINEIEEDPNIDAIEERWRRFGQDDHIRLYSKKGFIERVEAAGFKLNHYGVDFFGESVFFEHGISPKSILYIVEKK